MTPADRSLLRPIGAYSNAERDLIVCEFRPKNGSYYDRCEDLGTLTKRRSPLDKGERRCARHAAIDQRTAKNRAWDDRTDTYEPFEAVAFIKARRAAQDVEAQRSKDAERKACVLGALDLLLALNVTDTERKMLSALLADVQTDGDILDD